MNEFPNLYEADAVNAAEVDSVVEADDVTTQDGSPDELGELMSEISCW